MAAPNRRAVPALSRRQKKKRDLARMAAMLRTAYWPQPNGSLRLLICTPGRDRHIDLLPAECRHMAQMLLNHAGQ